jgi:hypothetical protein
VTLGYWSYLSDYSYTASEVMGSVISHTTPFLMTLIDFIFNEVQFYRIHYPISSIYMVFYSFCVLLPYTLALEVVYPGITFDNWFTYVYIIGLILFGLLCSEVGKRIKDRFKCFASDRSASGLDLQFRIND